jgi:hypothetical protein
MGGSCSKYRGRRGVYRVLVGKPEGQRPIGRPKLRWEDNIKMDYQEMRCEDMDLIALAQMAGTCECGNEHSGSIKCGEFLDELKTG